MTEIAEIKKAAAAVVEAAMFWRKNGKSGNHIAEGAIVSACDDLQQARASQPSADRAHAQSPEPATRPI